MAAKGAFVLVTAACPYCKLLLEIPPWIRVGDTHQHVVTCQCRQFVAVRFWEKQSDAG